MLEPFDDPDLATQHQFDSVFTIISKQKQIRLILKETAAPDVSADEKRISDLN
jgi:hypothetical protein